jgi:hypothetical protein
MRASRFVLAVTLGTWLLGSSGARAQETPTISIVEPEGQSTMLSYEEYRLRELHYLAGRSRTGLIVGASVTVAGAALVTPALVNECVRIASSSSFDDLRCSTRGKALLGVGIPILLGGVTTLLVTSIMFGVRRGRIRAIEDELEYRKRRVGYDPAKGAFTF